MSRPQFSVNGNQVVPCSEHTGADCGTDDEIAAFVAALGQLRAAAGQPSLRAMARTAHYSHTALSSVLAGGRMPSLGLTLAFVRACGGDEEQWRAAWREADSRVRRLPPCAAPPRGARPPDGRQVPAELPHDAPGFVGRVGELAGLRALIDRGGKRGGGQLVAVIEGPAGAGKTALAVHFAHQVTRSYPDGQLYIDLHGFGPEHPVMPDEALDQLLRSLADDPPNAVSGLDEKAGRYRTRLAGLRVLVVLDNVRDAGQVRPLLPGLPGCLVLVTSRHRLTSLASRDGAHRVSLDVLTQAEAVALIGRIAGARRVTAESGAAIAIARICGYLPLALQLAAERAAAARFLTMAEVAGELGADADPLSALSALTALPGDERSDPMRAALGFSYRCLPAPAARMFSLLGSRGMGEVSTQRAAMAADVPLPQARRLLEALASAHLLQEVGKDHYRFHELIRLYAAERAARGDPGCVQGEAASRLCRQHLPAEDGA
jgi:hypothetical protein